MAQAAGVPEQGGANTWGRGPSWLVLLQGTPLSTHPPPKHDQQSPAHPRSGSPNPNSLDSLLGG